MYFPPTFVSIGFHKELKTILDSTSEIDFRCKNKEHLLYIHCIAGLMFFLRCKGHMYEEIVNFGGNVSRGTKARGTHGRELLLLPQ